MRLVWGERRPGRLHHRKIPGDRTSDIDGRNGNDLGREETEGPDPIQHLHSMLHWKSSFPGILLVTLLFLNYSSVCGRWENGEKTNIL